MVRSPACDTHICGARPRRESHGSHVRINGFAVTRPIRNRNGQPAIISPVQATQDDVFQGKHDAKTGERQPGESAVFSPVLPGGWAKLLFQLSAD